MIGIEPGAVVAGRYQIEEPIGSGAHASVYRVYDRTLARSVAIKFLLVHDERRREWLTQRFVREARIAAAVEHPNVVRTLDFGTHEGRAYMVMELLEGESLGARFDRDPPLALDETVDVVCGVLAGLAAVHRAGIVHRDLKPDNVILVDEGGRVQPRIVDFGVSRAVRPSGGVRSAFTTREGLLVGTPEYMAPEQARGLADVDERVDIYALGVILYEALTGRLPYEAPVMAELIVAIVRGGAPSVRELAPSVPRSVSDVIEKAMALAPDGRYSTADTMAAELLQAIGRHDSAAAHARSAQAHGAGRRGTVAQYGSQPEEEAAAAGAEASSVDDAGARAPTLAGSPVDASGSAARAPTVRAAVPRRAAHPGDEEPTRPQLASLMSQVQQANEGQVQAPMMMAAEVGIVSGPELPRNVGIAHVAERRGGRVWGRLVVVVAVLAALAGAAFYTRVGRDLVLVARRQLARVAPAVAEDLNLSSTVTIRLLGVPNNATIRLDGTRIGGDVIELPRGDTIHLVEVSAPHRVTWSKSFDASSSTSFLVALVER